MAKAKIAKEPTLKDVYEVLTDFVGFTKNQFQKVESQFGKIGSTLEKHDKLFDLMGQQLQVVGKDVKDLKETTEKIDTRLRHVEQDVLSIREDVETLGKIAMRDSSTIKSQGHRITLLERNRRF
jgi:septation ring formation regulator EzrA